MRDTKSLLLLLVSLLLVLVSFVLIWTWGYSFYAKNDSNKNNTTPAAVDSAAIANKISDSLQKIYNATLQSLDLQLDSTLSNSDSLSNQLDAKLAEFYRLRSEIAMLLKNRNANNNFTAAREKIGELKNKMEGLKDKNQVVDKENKNLADVISNIGKGEKNTNVPAAAKSNVSEKQTPAFSPFITSDMRLAAINNTDDRETETASADKTDKFTGAFTVTNFNSQLTNAEMMVVVVKPDGRVLKGSAWDAGTFNTAEGKKIYSYKFNFTYSRGEAKRLAFSLKGGALTKGNYIMEVYHNGLMIGRLTKTLS